jgi:hypothetical protein
MTDLIHRLENATEGQERELLQLAFDLCFPCVTMASEGEDVSAYNAWVEIANDFDAMLDAHAWSSAAEMLVPDGAWPMMDYGPPSICALSRGRGALSTAEAPFPWAALAAASVKARG